MASFTVKYIFELVDRFSGKTGQMSAAAKRATRDIHAMGNAVASAEKKMAGGTRAGAAAIIAQRKAMEDHARRQEQIFARQEAFRKKRLEEARRAARGRSSGLDGGMMSTLLFFGGGRMVTGAIGDYGDYEKALLNIRKVFTGFPGEVGSVDEQFVRLKKSLAEINKTVPLTREEVAQLVEEGLRADVASSMEDLGRYAKMAAAFSGAFNVPIDQAAEGLAKLKGALQLSNPELERLGDSMAYLDQNMPASAADILEIARRAAPLGKIMAGNKGVMDLIALGAAGVSVGQKREIMATGLRTFLIRLQAAAGMTPDAKALAAMGMDPDEIAQVQEDLADGLKSSQAALKGLGLDPKDIAKGLTTDIAGTVKTILDRIRALPKEEQSAIINKIAGMRAMDAINPLLAAQEQMDKALALMASPDSAGLMMRQFEVTMQGVNAQMQAFSNHLQDLRDRVLVKWLPMLTAALGALGTFLDTDAGKLFMDIAIPAGMLSLALATMILPLRMLGWLFGPLAAGAGRFMTGFLAGFLRRSPEVISRLMRMKGPLAALGAAFASLKLGSIGGLLRFARGLGAIAVAIVAVEAAWPRLKSFFEGFGSGLSASWEGSEIQRGLAWMADKMPGLAAAAQSIGQYLSAIFDFSPSSNELAAWFDAGAAAAKQLLSPLSTIHDMLQAIGALPSTAAATPVDPFGPNVQWSFNPGALFGGGSAPSGAGGMGNMKGPSRRMRVMLPGERAVPMPPGYADRAMRGIRSSTADRVSVQGDVTVDVNTSIDPITITAPPKISVEVGGSTFIPLGASAPRGKNMVTSKTGRLVGGV